MALLPKYGPLPGKNHLVPDVLEPEMALVFCGTALGFESMRRRAYYANPGNFFWRALHETGLTPHRYRPEEYDALRSLNIGLTDLCKTAYGNDDELPADAFDVRAFEQKILQYQPKILAFTSKTGAAAYLKKPTGKLVYGFQHETIEQTRLYVLPSPSGQARRHWQQSVWQELADAYHGVV